jgi:hypothetical protein
MGPGQGSGKCQKASRLLRGGGVGVPGRGSAHLLGPDHSAEEDREITIARSAQQRIRFVAHALRDDRMRIISARRATSKERKQYEEGIDEATR